MDHQVDQVHLCYFVVRSLGHYLSSAGVQPTEDKVQAIHSLPVPRTVTAIKSFLGMVIYYSHHIPDCSRRALPLRALEKKGVPFVWGSEQQAAYDDLRQALCSAPLLRNADSGRPFILTCDWSSSGMGAALQQEERESDQRYVVSYYSRSCTTAEANYGSFKGEAVSLVYAVRHWRGMLHNGLENILETDNSALQWLMTSAALPAIAARWSLLLTEFNFRIVHIPGITNKVADHLSRPQKSDKKESPPQWPATSEEALAMIACITPGLEDDGGDEEGDFPIATSGRIALATGLLSVAHSRTAGEVVSGLVKASKATMIASLRPLIRSEVAPTSFFFDPLLKGLKIEQGTTLAAVVPGASPPGDIWSDDLTLRFLRGTEASLEGVLGAERDRVKKRAKSYFFGTDPSVSPGTGRICPQPSDRDGLVSQMHHQNHHQGVTRTYNNLARTHWWKGMQQQTASVIAACMACDMQKAAPLPPQAELRPHAVRWVWFRVHSDLFGPLAPSPEGYTYAFVAVDSFSGALFLIPLTDKTAASTARAARSLMGYLGPPAEWMTDGGGEWAGAFLEALEDNRVVHLTTSPNMPQSNGMAERGVQTTKAMLSRTLTEQNGSPANWADLLPSVMLAYNCSKHSSTGFSPYNLLFGREVLMPAQSQAIFREKIDITDASSALPRS